MSLFQWSRFVACFVDENGDYVGKKIFARSIFALGQSKKTFDYDGGSYNIKPGRASRLELSLPFAVFFDNYIYVYKIGNPDPLSFEGGNLKPIMEASSYKHRLKSKLVEDLNKVAKGGFEIPWKIVLPILIGIGIVMYFVQGGSLFGGNEAEIVNQTAQATIPIPTG